MTLKKLLAKNDDANPEFVLPLVFFSLIMGCIFTGTAIILAVQGGHQFPLAMISGVAVVSWASLAILMRKYSGISM